MVNRKLIRPSLADMPGSSSKFAMPGRKRVPPEQTHAENFYYVKQMNNRTPMMIKLVNGEELQGYIEWYDRDCIKFNRENAPNLLIYKTSMVYMCKLDESGSPDQDDDGDSRRRPRRHKSDSDGEQESNEYNR